MDAYAIANSGATVGVPSRRAPGLCVRSLPDRPPEAVLP